MTGRRPACDAEVIVVGGGPVGSLTALELTNAGVNVLVIEAAVETADVPKAGTIHARSIQLLTRRGHFRAPDPTAAPQSTLFHYAGQIGLPIHAPAGEGPAIAGIGQSDLERAWRSRLHQLGVPVLHPATVAGVVDAGDHVEVSVETDGSPRVLRARWVVGADGARSVVRRTGGFTAVEHSPTAAALLGLAVLDDPASAPAGWARTERGWTVINPNPNHAGLSRIITFDLTGPHRDHRSPLTGAELQASVDRIAGRPVPFRHATALSRFSDYARVVDSYRTGRLLAVGDAAHVHFPLGGQGLNLGIVDAITLGWRLAAVLAGDAAETSLDDFSRERRSAALQVVANVADQRDHMRTGPDGDRLRSTLRRTFTDPAAARELGDRISGQSEPPASALRAGVAGSFVTNTVLTTASGHRTSLVELLAGGHETLLLHSADNDDATAALDGGVPGECGRVRRIAVRESIPMVLVRPDGVLVWSSAHQTFRSAMPCLRAAYGRPVAGRSAATIT